MSRRHRDRVLVLVVVVLLLAAGCRTAEPAATTPAIPTRVAVVASETPLPPSVTTVPATATTTPPTPTQTPLPSTPTPIPPTETPLPPEPTATPLVPLAGSGGGVIAFTSDRADGQGDIYVMNADGSNPQRLTDDPAYDAWPTWSPDGAQIAFMSTRSGNPDIWVMDADGSNLRQLTDDPANDIWPEWSPALPGDSKGGGRIAFPSRRDGNFELYVVDADGTNLQRLTNSPGHEDFPTWSPDGTQILFSRIEQEEGTYVMDAGGTEPGSGEERRLLDFPALEPAWSPDGSQIAFASDHGGFRGIYVMDAYGGNLQQLSDTRAGENCPAWSPATPGDSTGGAQIAFASWRDGDGEIYVMDADGSNLRQLTDNRFEDEFPAWRPATGVHPSVSQLAGLPIEDFFSEAFRQLQIRDPDILLANQLADFYGATPGDQFTSLAARDIAETQQLEREILDLLHTYDRSALAAEGQYSYDALDWHLTMQVRGQAFADYRFLVNPVWGLQNWPIDFLLEHPLEDKQDAERYVARLSSLDAWMDQVIEGLKRNEQAGAIPPEYVLQDTIARLDEILNMQGGRPGPADQHDVYTHLRQKAGKIEDLGDAERQALLQTALAAVEEVFIPAYQALRDHLVYLAGAAIRDPDQWQLPGGQTYYDYLLAYYTGTDLSAGEIHRLGLDEIARLQAAIQEAAADVGYPGGISMPQLNQRMASDAEIITGDPLLREYERILAAAKQASGGFFDLQAKADVVIRTDRSGPPASYKPPVPDSGDPGEMPVNPDVSPRYVNYNEHVLVHHETIPGHHTQYALAQELDLPAYQRFQVTNPYLQDYPAQAYIEGWALYAEGLAWEMGLYEGDAFANLGRLRLHLIRTVRMVVDTGIHASGWTLDEAADYIREVTGMAQSRAQLTRYLVNPGYACGYNVGGLKIREMRQRAQDRLGERFDIKEFHNTVLGHGILPIGVLDGVVDDWIAQTLARGPADRQAAYSSALSLADALAGLQELPFDVFLESSYRQLQLRDPDQLVLEGLAEEYGIPNDRFTDMSDGYVRQTQQLESAILDLLRSYDRDALPAEGQLSYDVYEWVLEDRVRGHPFTYYDYPVNPLTIWGKQNWLIDFMVSHQPIAGRQDAEDYVARLSQIDTWVDQLLEGLKLREQAGVVPPRYLLDESIRQIAGHLQMQGPDTFDLERIELYSSFRDKLDRAEGIGPSAKQELLERARAEIRQTFVPAFATLRDHLIDLRASAGSVAGVHRFPDGQAYYVYLIGRETGTGRSPAEVHELGLSEVARIQAEMRAAAVELGYADGMSMSELAERVSTEAGLVVGAPLLAESERLIAEVERAAAPFFDRLPDAELVIRREPFGSAVGYYAPPPLDGSGPGVFYTNADLAVPRHIVPTYIYHETIPGHHLQGALARELDLPTFRRALLLNGYAEGWALYAERLAREMGLYEEDPLANLGRLEMELARAARLVIDTGLHAKGWSRQDAADYYADATGRPTSAAAMNRYVILPGQGCGYTVGLLEILAWRQRAMDHLGDRFDVKAFHDLLLGQGPLPLAILEQRVDAWLADD